MQASLSVYPEAVTQEPGGAEMSIKQESLEQGVWSGPTGSPHSSIDVASRTKRVGSSPGGKLCITILKLCHIIYRKLFKILCNFPYRIA